MERTIGECDLKVQARVAGENTFFLGELEALLNCWPEFTWHVTTNNLGFELEAFTWLEWFELEEDLRELTRTTGLLLVYVAVFDCLSDALAVSNLWLTNDRFNAVGALQDVDLNIEVKLAHAMQDGFAGIFVSFDDESRIFCNHLTNRCAHLLRVSLVLRLNCDGDNRLREYHRLESRWEFRITECVTCLH